MRTLYDCMEARYPTEGTRIYCRKGHPLPQAATTTGFQRMAKFECKVCQECDDFNDADEVTG